MENCDFGKSFVNKFFAEFTVIPKRNSRKTRGSWLSPLICAANAKSVAKYSLVCNEMQVHLQVFLHFSCKRKLCRFLLLVNLTPVYFSDLKPLFTAVRIVSLNRFPTSYSRTWIKYHILCVILELNLIPRKITAKNFWDHTYFSV